MNQNSNLREIFPDHITKRIEEIIIPDIKKVKLKAKIEGIRRISGWEEAVSEQNLHEFFIHRDDIDTCGDRKNIISFSKDKSNKLIHLIKEIYPDKIVYTSGHFYYPPTGYMGWHTNQHLAADRVYISFASESNKAFFRYYENGRVITDYDQKGINIRRFSCKSNKPYFWHCVGSDCDRFSFGFRLCDIT